MFIVELLNVVVSRQTNSRLLCILLCVSVCSVIILVLYQLSYPPNNSKNNPNGHRKYDFHDDEYGDRDFMGTETEIHDSVVALQKNPHHEKNVSSVGVKSIAIGCAITSHNEEHLSLENIAYKLPFLRTLVPSFCKTASAGYEYHFYAAFDMRDPHLIKEQFMEAIYERFNEIVELICPKNSKSFLHFVQCNHNHNPTWAQNDAMMEAYLDHVEYYYRLNDDTLMLTPGWTETFIDGLQGFSPPNVGVVGPLHKGGNEAILTYDFVHRTHIDIFGYYYPRVFTDWWADDWITKVYGDMRTLKMPSVRLIHTGEAGTRYEVKHSRQKFLEEQIKEDQETLERHLKAVKEAASRKLSTTTTVKVISMSLWSSKTRYTFGALRNAQLMPVYFPGWTLRVYIEKPRDDGTTRFLPVPDRIVVKLARLGVEIMHVDAEQSHIPPMMWRFLIADDMSVDLFIVRDSDCRLQDRDAAVVKDWITSKTPFHCIRDHPSHIPYPVLGGLWGGMPKKLHEIIPIPWQELMMGTRAEYSQDMSFLASAIWPQVQNYAFCHDSVSCKKWTNSHPFPLSRTGTEHLGQVFDAFGNARDEDIQILLENRPNAECTIQQKDREIEEVTTRRMFITTADHGKRLETIAFISSSSALSSNISSTNRDRSSHKKHLQKYQKVFQPIHATANQNLSRAITGLNQSANSQTSSTQSASVPYSFTQNASVSKASNKNTSSSLSAVVWSMDYSIFFVHVIKYLTSSHSLQFLDKSLASGCKTMGTCARNLRVITRKNGLNVNGELIRLFHEEYELDPEMNLVTHFLCTYPATMCELYVGFDRPLIIYISSRYEHGKYTVAKWRQWNGLLKSIANDRQNRILASNIYDARYLQYFTGISATVIPLQCGYINATYSSTKNTVLLSVSLFPNFDEFFLHKFENAMQNNSDYFKLSLSENEMWFSASRSHIGVIHIPYDAVSKHFCEDYAKNIPIFIPNIELVIDWHFQYDILSQLTWNSIRKLMGENASRSPLPPADVGLRGIPDPNENQNKKSITYWLELTDFYQSPNVIFFSSFDDLRKKLETVDFHEISRKMRKENERKKVAAFHQWRDVFEKG